MRPKVRLEDFERGKMTPLDPKGREELDLASQIFNTGKPFVLVYEDGETGFGVLNGGLNILGLVDATRAIHRLIEEAMLSVSPEDALKEMAKMFDQIFGGDEGRPS